MNPVFAVLPRESITRDYILHVLVHWALRYRDWDAVIQIEILGLMNKWKTICASDTFKHQINITILYLVYSSLVWTKIWIHF